MIEKTTEYKIGEVSHSEKIFIPWSDVAALLFGYGLGLLVMYLVMR